MAALGLCWDEAVKGLQIAVLLSAGPDVFEMGTVPVPRALLSQEERT